MTVILTILFCIMFFLLLGAIAAIGKLQKQIELLDREQHQQNKEAIELMKFRSQVAQTLFEHSEILQYFAEKDELLGKRNNFFTGPVGEA